LAKKDGSKSDAPVVTSLPLPSSDSVLVIDLPDGQKLLVGKMAPGSVIEVATWRGTGRPDSRTNRLMLGISNGEYTESPQDVQQEEINKLSLAYFMYLIRNIPPYLLLFFNKAKDKVLSLIKKESETTKTSSVESADLDVDEWIKQITSRVKENEVALEPKANSELKSSKSARKTPQKQKSTAKKSRKSA